MATQIIKVRDRQHNLSSPKSTEELQTVLEYLEETNNFVHRSMVPPWLKDIYFSVVEELYTSELAKLGDRVPAQVEVVEGEGGVTISLADDASGGMFPVGSAKPTADAIRMMETIAAVLSKRAGTITIRGHTDSRPYSNGEYDNWRLSTSRTHMAYYMLARGGLDESRVKAIEGFADREPKDSANPEAAINRRIEIFLTEPQA